jgi:hypothetical protein
VMGSLGVTIVPMAMAAAVGAMMVVVRGRLPLLFAIFPIVDSFLFFEWGSIMSN